MRAARQKRSQETAERILEATRRLLETRTFLELSLDEIAHEANAARSSLYARFPTKHSLLTTIHENYCQKTLDEMHRFVDTGIWKDIPIEDLAHLIWRTYIQKHRENAGVIRATRLMELTDESFGLRRRRMDVELTRCMNKVLTARSSEFGHPDQETAVKMVGWIVSAAARSLLDSQSKFSSVDLPSDDRLAEELADLSMQYLRVKPARRAEAS